MRRASASVGKRVVKYDPAAPRIKNTAPDILQSAGMKPQQVTIFRSAKRGLCL